jgi:hypothetical protein
VAGVVGVVGPVLDVVAGEVLPGEPPPPPQADNIASAVKTLASRRIEGVRVGEMDREFIPWIISCI